MTPLLSGEVTYSPAPVELPADGQTLICCARPTTELVRLETCDGFRVVQVTPPGSACSIQFGDGLTDAVPGSARANYLVVADLEATRAELVARGIKVGDIRHKTPADTWAGDATPGIDPGRRSYASMAELADPDGNTCTCRRSGSDERVAQRHEHQVRRLLSKGTADPDRAAVG